MRFGWFSSVTLDFHIISKEIHHAGGVKDYPSLLRPPTVPVLFSSPLSFFPGPVVLPISFFLSARTIVESIVSGVSYERKSKGRIATTATREPAKWRIMQLPIDMFLIYCVEFSNRMRLNQVEITRLWSFGIRTSENLIRHRVGSRLLTTWETNLIHVTKITKGGGSYCDRLTRTRHVKTHVSWVKTWKLLCW